MGIAVFAGLYDQSANHGSQDARRRQQEREQDARGLIGDDSQGEGGDQGAHIGLEQVRAHAGYVAHVVAHIVGDYGRVAGVVLRNSGFHLTHQVRAHVGRLGVDAAAHTGEQRDGGCAQAEAGEHAHVTGDDVKRSHAHEPQANHGHAHDAAAGKRDGERAVHAGNSRRVGSPAVGADRCAHSQITGRGGEGASHQKTARCNPAVGSQADDHKEHGHKDNENAVLRSQKGPGALGDGVGDHSHFFSSRILLDDLGAGDDREQEADQADYRDNPI